MKGCTRACLKIALCQPCVTICTQGYDMGDLFRMRALSGLQQPNKGKICHKVGRMGGVNEFSNTL